MQLTLPEMRFLTVQQPWADFLVPDQGVIDRVGDASPDIAGQLPKDVENRPFGTDWRGTVLILAGKKLDVDALDRFGLTAGQFVTGAVVGKVTLVDVVDESTSRWAMPGMRHWQVADHERLLSPILYRGHLGLRVAPEQLVRETVARFERQRVIAGA